MSSPASILFTTEGQPIGVSYDGVTYRLQVETQDLGLENLSSEETSSETLLFQHILLNEIKEVNKNLAILISHMKIITDEDDPL